MCVINFCFFIEKDCLTGGSIAWAKAALLWNSEQQLGSALVIHKDHYSQRAKPQRSSREEHLYSTAIHHCSPAVSLSIWQEEKMPLVSQFSSSAFNCMPMVGENSAKLCSNSQSMHSFKRVSTILQGCSPVLVKYIQRHANCTCHQAGPSMRSTETVALGSWLRETLTSVHPLLLFCSNPPFPFPVHRMGGEEAVHHQERRGSIWHTASGARRVQANPSNYQHMLQFGSQDPSWCFLTIGLWAALDIPRSVVMETANEWHFCLFIHISSVLKFRAHHLEGTTVVLTRLAILLQGVLHFSTWSKIQERHLSHSGRSQRCF